MPDLRSWPQGCRFNPRCPLADDIRRIEAPAPAAVAQSQLAACWHVDRLAALDA